MAEIRTYQCEFCKIHGDSRQAVGVTISPKSWYKIVMPGRTPNTDFCSLRCLALWAVREAGKK